ncbi:hypothetical protein WMY93_003214 [Mugilogobius chulae]|uniref:Deleted in malignant brain tumors 1 protein-like n=1 Tax=Mugilogobius chulae TaxID=88201 RepID=A0AAW0PVI8_9GOBI
MHSSSSGTQLRERGWRAHGERRRAGVGLLIVPQLSLHVLEFTPVDKGGASLRLRLQFVHNEHNVPAQGCPSVQVAPGHPRPELDDRLCCRVIEPWPRVLDTRVKRGAELSTGHHLVVSWIRWQRRKLDRLGRPKRIKVTEEMGKFGVLFLSLLLLIITECADSSTTAPPPDTTAPPPDTTAPTTYTTAPPPDTTAPPTYTTAPPTYTTASPPDTTAPPSDTTAHPPDTTAPPTYTTARPNYTTAHPPDTTALESSRPAVDGDVRLVKTRSCCSGRVEIFYQGCWGSVCYSDWDVNDANVVCRQLGFDRAQYAVSYPAGPDPIWLSSARCRGSELSITDCGTLGYYSCSLNAVAGVICQANQSDPGSEGDVRLVNGNSFCSGRVEIFHQGQWGSVEVVCRQLDCGRAQETLLFSIYGVGGPVWLTYVSCNGSELSLTDCGHSTNVDHNGNHRHDAGVTCEGSSNTVSPITTPPPDFRPGVEGEVRLTGDEYSYCLGRVEIFHQGQWGSVCGDGWDINAAHVACRQAGCGMAVNAFQDRGRPYRGIWMSNVSCIGSETSLTDCTHNFKRSCSSDDASAHCLLPYEGMQIYPFICGRDKIQAGLDSWYVSLIGLDSRSGHLLDRSCRWSRITHQTVWYEVEPREGVCGNIRRTNRTHVIYSNSIFLYAHNDSFSVPKLLPFSCAYPLETEAELNASLRLLFPMDGVVASGEAPKAVMSLYLDQSYTNTYPSGSVSLPVGQPLYVGISVQQNDTGFVTVIDECYFTTSSNPKDTSRHPLIQNKCSVDRQQVLVIESGKSLRARFAALLFEPLGPNWTVVYLHCHLALCSPGPCVPFCSGKARRSASEDVGKETVTAGPITFGPR